jgi:hypothetical protein
MRNHKFSWLALSSAIFIEAGCTVGTDIVGADEKAADTVLVKGEIYTADEENSWAEAAAVKDGTIVYVGSMEGINSYIGEQTEVIDLEGKFAMPSFVDGHLHPLSNSYSYLFQAALFDLNTTEQYIEKIREFAEKHPDLKGIMGAGFDPSLYDAIGPRKEWLDAIDSERPIGIVDRDIHSIWVNSKALEMLGITKDTPDPHGGVIVRDPETGEPSGLLLEWALMGPAWALFPSASKEDYKTSLLWMQDWLNREGITTAHDAWAEYDPNYYEAFDELAKERKLTVRYRGSWYIDPADDYLDQIDTGLELAERFNHPHFKAHSFKFLADQVIQQETAFLLEPYSNRPDFHGIRTWEDEDLVKAFAKVDRAGHQIHVHVIGDGAARYTVDALERVQEINGKRDSRHSLAHLEMAKPRDIKRMGELGLSAHVTPQLMGIDPYFFTRTMDCLGPERAYNQFPNKSLVDAGVNVTVASDFVTAEPDPIFAIFSGMERMLPFEKYQERFGDDDSVRYVTDPNVELKEGDIGRLPPLTERLSLEEMIRAATINGAYANFLEDEVGSLEVGKKADIVVLSKNLFKIETEEIPNVKIMMTFFEGERVY